METIIYTHRNQENKMLETRMILCLLFLILLSAKSFSQTRPGTNPVIYNKSLNEAPKTIMPMCNSNVTLSVPQNIIFTWLDPSASLQLGNTDLPNGVQEYVLKIVEIIGSQSANDAIKYPTIPPFFEKTILGTSYIYGPADPPLKPAAKYAYTVSVKYNSKQYQNNGVSDVCMFTCKAQQMPANTSPPAPNQGPVNYGIVLLDPIQGKKIVSGYGLTLQWKPANNKADYYLLEFTDSYSQDKKITDWSNLTDELFTGKNAFYASSPDPANDAKNGVITDTKYSLSPSWTNGLGKIAWRIVACDKKNNHIDSSGVETYEIIEDNADTKIKDFMMCGFAVHILSIQNKDTSNYSCTGEFYLWEGGPKIVKQFDGLKLKPFMYNAKAKVYYWFATGGQLYIDDLSKVIAPKNIVDLEPDQNTDGNFSLKMTKLRLIADVNCKYNESKQLFDVIQDKSSCKVTAELTWETDWFNWDANQSWTDNLVEIKTQTKELDFSFKDKFSESKLFLAKDEVVKTATKGGISILFNGLNYINPISAVEEGVNSSSVPTYFLLKGFSVIENLSGNVNVPNTKPASTLGNQFINLSIPFSNKGTMNFKTKIQPLTWNLNDDGSVVGSVNEVIVHLGHGPVDGKDISNKTVGILVPTFKTTVKYSNNQNGIKEGKDMILSFSNVYNGGAGFQTNNTSENDQTFELDLGGFYAKSDVQMMKLNKNKLIYLFIGGDIYVPFLNRYGTFQLDADNEKINEGNIYFTNTDNYLIGSIGSNEAFVIDAYSGILTGNRIQLSPHLTISNYNQKGISASDLITWKLYIAPDGNISFDKSTDNAYISYINQKNAAYYKFDYNIDRVGMQKIAGSYDYKISFRGDLILGPKISTSNWKETYFIYHGKAPEMTVADVKPVNTIQIDPQNAPKNITVPKDIKVPKNIKTPGGPYPNDESVENTEDNASIDLQDDGVDVDGEYEDGGQSFGGEFKLVKDDPIWGDYFSLAGHYYTKEPNSSELSASMILGKIKSNSKNYSYWYLDFFQKNVVTIPVIPGIVELNGFGGKTYYHMYVTHDNNGKISSLVPNDNYSLGIEAEALFRTSFDQGRTLHGQTQIIIGFSGWSLDGIVYSMQGEFLSPDDNSSGLLHTKVNAAFDYKNKSFTALAAVWGNVYNMICINGNKDIYNLDFKLSPNGIDMWVGTPEDPVVLSAMCSMNIGAWTHIYNNGIAGGFVYTYNTGWKGVDIGGGFGTVQGKVVANFAASAAIQFSPFNVTGNVHLDGTAYGKGCLIYACYKPHAGVAGDLKLSLPNPFLIKGNVSIDVPVIPTFSVCVQFKNGSFSFC